MNQDQEHIAAVAAERRDLLKVLARSANSAHASARGAAGAALAHIIAAGNALAGARGLCGEGEWGAWVRANFDGSLRTAQRYVRASRCWPVRIGDATSVSRATQSRALGAVRGLLFAPPKIGGRDALFATEPDDPFAEAQGGPDEADRLNPSEFMALACARLRPTVDELRALLPGGDDVSAAVVERVRALYESLAAERACDSDEAESFVYIIEAVGADRIKIGVASDPLRRLAQLQTGSPIPLRLLAQLRGGRGVERALHVRFAGFRLAGEWFHLTRWSRRTIETLCSDGSEAHDGASRSVDRTSQGGGNDRCGGACV